jgi:hypothetical protein
MTTLLSSRAIEWCLLLASGFVALPSNAQELARDAIVRIEVRGQTEKGPYVRIGTGFLVGDKGAVLTARHLFQPSDSPWARDELTDTLRTAIYVSMRDLNGLLNDRRQGVIEMEDARLDVALLKVEGSKFNPGLPTCPERVISGGEVVVVRGFPTRVERSSDRPGGDTLEAATGALFDSRLEDGGSRLISASTRPGFSGAPVFHGDRVIGLLTGGFDGRLTISPESKLTMLSALRGKVLGSCPVACRHYDHGVERYQQTTSWSADSGWRRGGSSPGEFCGAQLVQRMKQFPERRVTVVGTDESARWTGFANREREYRYTCQMLDEWNPLYKEDLTRACEQLAGTVVNLPR